MFHILANNTIKTMTNYLDLIPKFVHLHENDFRFDLTDYYKSYYQL